MSTDENRFVCVHGHFYQPPRENPWLDLVEVQDSAAPYHDWNERITAECYGPNAAARILGEDGLIESIVNNYAQISFNFGATLLSWLERAAPDVYQAILEADRDSQEQFGGHGSALAQAYGHAIMPLANERDKRTQVIWGVRDFEARFGRAPEGMWLPETAVDTDTLEALAEAGIAFTILAPHQVRRVRHHDTPWQDMDERLMDTTQPYSVMLPSGRSIAVFFYDGPLSRAVAFEQVLSSGVTFARRLADAAGPGDVPRLVNIAADGETYGHHHRFGEMGLAYALQHLRAEGHVRLTNYGQYLDLHPPRREAEIHEATSWSCLHGVERWRSDCGCNTGTHPQWRQHWRGPLRAALDWLRDKLAERYEGAGMFADPWQARDDYIDVILDGSEESVLAFLTRHCGRAFDAGQQTRALKLLEMQRHALLMYASCAWFFDDLSGIETVQGLSYACRAVQLAEDLFGDGIEQGFLTRLSAARSNLVAQGTGADIYRRHVLPTSVDLRRAAAHYAVDSLFSENQSESIGLYDVEPLTVRRIESGRSHLALGRIRVRCRADRESGNFHFAALHLGDQNLTGGLAAAAERGEFDKLAALLEPVFTGGDFTAAIRLIDEHFGGEPLSLRSLFRDEQRRVIRRLLQPALDEAENSYRHLYEQHVSLLRFLASFDFPVPNRLRMASEVALNLELGRELERDDLAETRVIAILEEGRLVNIEFDQARLSLQFESTLERLASAFAEDAGEAGLRRLEQAVSVLKALPFTVNLWKVQNTLYWTAQRLLAEDETWRQGPLAERLLALGRELFLALRE